MPSSETIQKVLADLEQGFGPSFFAHVADNISWTVTGTSENPVAGHYTSKETLKAPYQRVGAVMEAPGIKPHIHHYVVGDDGETLVIEFTATGKPKKRGEYALQSCWICKFEGDLIVEARVYMDSAHMKKVIEENSP
jgi:uncharacterized protein